MADFPTMAAETTSNLSTLLEETEQTQTSLQEAKAEITRVRQQVEEAWSGLSDRAQSLLERVNAGKNELSAKVESSTQVIAQLKQKIDTVQQELTQELEETKTAIAATDDKLNELIPELEESLNDTESALNSLQEKEIGVELEQAATSTGQKISEVNDELQSVDDVEDRRVAVVVVDLDRDQVRVRRNAGVLAVQRVLLVTVRAVTGDDSRHVGAVAVVVLARPLALDRVPAVGVVDVAVLVVVLAVAGLVVVLIDVALQVRVVELDAAV